MGKKVRSARGEHVDFDLIKIKEQMASAPPPQDVKARQNFIDRRARRRIKQIQSAAPVAPAQPVDVSKTLPGAEEVAEEAVIPEVKAKVEPKVKAKPATRQKARAKKKQVKVEKVADAEGDS